MGNKEIKPRGEIPKHIMEGVLSGIERDQPKTEHKEEMMTTQIPKAEPAKKVPKVEAYYEETRISKPKKSKDFKGDSVDPEKLQKLLDKANTKEQKKGKILEGTMQPKSITEKKLEAIQKILSIKETEGGELKIEPIDWKNSGSKIAQKQSIGQEDEIKKGKSFFPKINFKNVKSALPYIILILLVVIVSYSIIQFGNVTGNAVSDDINGEYNHTGNETSEPIEPAIADVGGKLKDFMLKNIFGGLDSMINKQESQKGSITDDANKSINASEQGEGSSQTGRDEITQEEVIDYLKQKFLKVLT